MAYERLTRFGVFYKGRGFGLVISSNPIYVGAGYYHELIDDGGSEGSTAAADPYGANLNLYFCRSCISF